MIEYTQWWIKYPWHVTGTKESGNVPADCDCGCRHRDEAESYARSQVDNLDLLGHTEIVD